MIPIHIVIPGYNLSGLTVRCLHAVARSTVDVSICYVDNGSDREELKAIQSFLDALDVDTNVIANDTNMGFTHAIQQGLNCRDGRHVVTLNNDCRVTETCLQSMLSIMTDNVASVCPTTNDHGVCSVRRPVNRRLRKPRSMRVLPWFCCLLNANALEQVDQLPTATEMASGLGVDDWWSQQLYQRGWQHLLCHNAFAAHDHKSTFRYAQINRRQLQRKAIQWLQKDTSLFHPEIDKEA